MAAKTHPGNTGKTTTAETKTTATDLQAEIDRLRAENDALKAQSGGGSRAISLKISAKGALSVYGMGRFPVTLYREQWEKLLDAKDEILEFIKTHDAELKRKEAN